MSHSVNQPARAGSDLARLFLRTGSLTFGGGPAGVAALHKELVNKRGWLGPEKFALCYALARITPGTNLLALCVATGWSILGGPGALIAVLCLSLPSAAIVVILTHLYETWTNHPLAVTIIRGILAATIGIIVATVWVLVRPGLTSTGWFRTLAIVTGGFVLAVGFSLTPIRVLGLAAVVGFLWPERRKARDLRQCLSTPLPNPLQSNG